MLRVKLTSAWPDWPLLRQTPGSKGIWSNCQFFVEPDLRDCDFWVVYDDLLQLETTSCPPENVILITGEPPDVKRYPTSYVGQYGAVITCQRRIRHGNVSYGQQALAWRVGIRQLTDKGYTVSMDYDKLSAMRTFEKDRLLSTISSSKNLTEGHRRRLDFVRALAERMGDHLHVYGKGLNEIADKWDAIYPYKYHIVLENSSVRDYWTEKLADAFLAGAFPFYYGCPNSVDYFPAGSFLPIPLDVEGAAKIIERATHENVYERSQSQIMAARELVLNEYNLFPMICRLANARTSSGPALPVTIRPMSSFPPSTLDIALTKVRGLPARLKASLDDRRGL